MARITLGLSAVRRGEGWFNDRFLQYKKPEDILEEQYQLPVLAMAEDRYYFIISKMQRIVLCPKILYFE